MQQALDRLRAANEAMKRAGGAQGQAGQQAGQQSGQQSAEAARRAAEQLRAAQSLLGGAQQQQASSKLDKLAQQAGQLTKQESEQAARIRALAEKSQQTAGSARTQADITEMMNERNRLADARQKLSDDLDRVQKGMRDTARETAATQPGTSSKLRDALSAMDESDLRTRTQRSADWLRSGINPESNGTEQQIAAGLKSLSEQIQQAAQGMGAGADGKNGQRRAGQGTETAALGHVDKLRNELQALGVDRAGSSRGQGGNPGGNQPGRQGIGQRGGQQPGQPGSRAGQQAQGGQPGQAGQQGGQQGGQQPGQGGQRGGQQTAQNGQGGGNRGGDQRNGTSGDVGGDTRRGGGSGDVAYNYNTGNNRYGTPGKGIDNPDFGATHGDPQKAIDQGLQELNQLRALAKNDPAALKEIDDLVKSMQNLDPSRFPGNPAMVEKLHTQVLNDVDKLELQLRRNPDSASGEVRTAKPKAVPPGYEDAVAEYYRRLGKGQ